MHITIVVTCSGCACTDELHKINGMDWDRYIEEGANVQDVWPDLTADAREMLIGARTGGYTCPDCWDKLFADMEDES